jgi:hypothetical protein
MTGQNFPPTNSRVVNDDGYLTQPWRSFLVELWKRTGEGQESIIESDAGILGGGRIGDPETLLLDGDHPGNVDHTQVLLLPGAGISINAANISVSFEISVNMDNVLEEPLPDPDTHAVLVQGEHGLRKSLLVNILGQGNVANGFLQPSGDQKDNDDAKILASGDQLVGNDGILVSGDQAIEWLPRPVRLESYEVSLLPGANALGIGSMLYITDEGRPAVSDGADWLRLVLDGIQLQSPSYLPEHTVSSAPASGTASRVIFVSNGDAGNPCLALDDGADWRRIVLGTPISAT